MIDRIVLFKLKDEHANASGRAEVARHSREALASISGPLEVRVGVPADPDSEKSWDLSIVVRFEDVDAMKEFVKDRDHLAYFREYMTPKMEVVKYWSFEVP